MSTCSCGVHLTSDHEFLAAVLGCSSQTPAITLREPKIFVPVCQLDSSVCLVYATVRWVPAVGADYQVVVSLQRSSMAVVPLEFRPVEGNETSFSVVFALNISDTEYRLRARILQGGSMIASSKDLILTFPQVGMTAVLFHLSVHQFIL